MSKVVFSIIDDFFPDPDVVFDAIASQNFKPYRSIWDGVKYPGINQEVPEDIKQYMVDRLSAIVNCNIKAVIFARAMLKGMVAPHRVHSDRIMGEMSCHVYLSKESPKNFGTSFWEHKTEGKVHTDYTDVETIERDSQDETKWQRDLLAVGRYNRAVIHDASMFHAAEPKEGWGDHPSNGRLVLTAFFGGL